MAYIIRMPKLGMEMREGTLLEWQVEVMELVDEGDVLAEIESEKTTAAVEAREDGVLRRTFIDVGDTVGPGDPIGIVARPDEDITDLEAAADVGDGEIESEPSMSDQPDWTTREPDAVGAERTQSGDVRASPRARKQADELDVDLTRLDGSGPDGAITADDVESVAKAGSVGEIRASPRAEKQAKSMGIDLATVEGTGPGGAITAEDVEAAGSTPTTPTPEADGPPALTILEERPLDGMRRTIANRLGESYREAIHVTEHRRADVEELFAAIEATDVDLEVDVSLLDLLLLVVSASLEEHPEFNARFEDGVHRIYKEHNIGIAVDIEAGLIAPVLPDVDGKIVSEIATERRTMTKRALDEEYRMDDLANGTFTVTNLGVFGVESFDPIINPPQIAILGVNAIQERAVPAEDGVEFRRHLPLDLSFDHRIVDGADAARFLETIIGHIEHPWPLLRAAGGAEEPVVSGPPSADMPRRSVTAKLTSGLAGVVEVGSFEVPFDEPESLGGTGTAPTPVDLYLASFAACMIESIRHQAVEKRSYTLEEVVIDADAEPEQGAVESISVHVSLAVDADDDAVERLVELGKRGCHVSQLLRRDIPFDLTWTRL